MLQTSIIVELLRSQPRLTFWFMALTQTMLWWVFPSLFFSSPPGDLPVVLAVGHEYQLGSYFGPPLAFWLADIAYVAGGATAVYLLAQACVLVMLWAVFTLGRAVVGIHHAAFAVLLMVGISAFSAPTPNFGPEVLAMPLVALSLLSLWRAVGEQRRVSWFVLGLELGLLILTTYAGLILLGAHHRVPGGDAAWPQRDALGRAVARERPHRRRAVPAPDVARPLERPRHARLAAAARRRCACRGPAATGSASSRRFSSPMSGS